RQTRADPRGLRFRNEIDVPRTGPLGAVEDGPLLDRGDAARYGDDDPRAQAPAAPAGLVDEVAEHGFAELEVGNHAVLQRAHGGDRLGGPAEHLAGELAYGRPAPEDFTRPFFERHDRGLVEYDPAPLDGDEGVGGPEIDGEVWAEPAAQTVEHPC